MSFEIKERHMIEDLIHGDIKLSEVPKEMSHVITYLKNYYTSE